MSNALLRGCQRLRPTRLPQLGVSGEGDVYALARRFDSAIEAYEAAQRLQPRAAVAIKLFHVRRTAKLARPEEVLTQWLARAPADVEVRRVLASFYESNGMRAEAIAQYKRLQADGRSDAIALNNLAWLLHQEGDPAALEMARTAYELAPGAPEIADTYGWILVQTGNIQQGLEMLKRAEADGGQNGEIAYHLAVAHAKSGQKELAAQVLTKLLASTQDFPSRSEAEGSWRASAPRSSPPELWNPDDGDYVMKDRTPSQPRGAWTLAAIALIGIFLAPASGVLAADAPADQKPAPTPTVQAPTPTPLPPAATTQAPPAAGPVEPDSKDYKIGPGDSLQIYVWQHPDLSVTIPVRPDGKISTPLVEDLVAVNRTPHQLARDIETALKVSTCAHPR